MIYTFKKLVQSRLPSWKIRGIPTYRLDAYIIRKATKWYCRDCNTYLCHKGTDTDCFLLYHLNHCWTPSLFFSLVHWPLTKPHLIVFIHTSLQLIYSLSLELSHSLPHLGSITLSLESSLSLTSAHLLSLTGALSLTWAHLHCPSLELSHLLELNYSVPQESSLTPSLELTPTVSLTWAQLLSLTWAHLLSLSLKSTHSPSLESNGYSLTHVTTGLSLVTFSLLVSLSLVILSSILLSLSGKLIVTPHQLITSSTGSFQCHPVPKRSQLIKLHVTAYIFYSVFISSCSTASLFPKTTLTVIWHTFK